MGRAFHTKLDRARPEGSTLTDHPPDETHDRAAGAACLMILEGAAAKGVGFYNRWAALAGYPPIALRSLTPVVIDIGANVVVQLRKSKMEVLKCP
jgi:hypothetical protein